MSLMKYASAMLAPAGSGRMAERLGLFAVATAGALAAAPTASALEYYATWTDSGDGFSDTFDLTPFLVEPGTGAAYTVTNETGGYGFVDAVFLQADYTGVAPQGFGFVVGPTAKKKDGFVPSPYAGDPAGALVPGSYTGYAFDSVLTISAIPEPEAWALIVSGAGFVGGALRSRRRRAAALA
jgi:hypothetical protein